ncbi:hypothetical protein DK419_13190 [Methylobacterium terrae]|uniref:Bacteriophage tail tape measure N-terminal domain-containing protein n=1 Tax=Methylobacterium terrae TaxID=2202827 RepID=A0A2U8WNP8_9HYPH|nr:phage tail length tape measure family protein [Methylobacterium terrae]AWN47151.1 hypothetical protein DK419_13190 [Methylobacterium terrae]
MADLATLGIAIDSRPVAQAITELSRFTQSSAKAETAAEQLSKSLADVGAAATKSNTAIAAGASANSLAASLQQVSRAADDTGKSLDRQRDALGRFVSARSGATRAAAEGSAAEVLQQRSLGGVTGALEQSLAAHVRAEAAAGKWNKTVTETANTTRLAAYQVQNLRSQFVDVGVSLQGGMNPLTVLLQQGPQIAQVFGPGTGLRGIIGGIVTEAQALVPLSVGIAGGILGGVGAVARGYLAWDAAQKQVAVGITGLGRQSGIAAGEIEQIARSSTLATDSAARYATAFASTGNASRDTLADALKFTRDFSTTFGTSFDEAAKIQTEFFSDTSTAYDKYAARLGAYNATTSRLISDLQKQGKGTDAVRVAFEQINPALARYNDLASYSTKATTFLSDAWGNLWSNVNRGAAVVMNDSRLTTTPQQISAAAEQGELARRRADAERASAVIIERSRQNQLLNVNPVERDVLTSQERAGVKVVTPTIDERFSNAFGAASMAPTGSFGGFPSTYGQYEKRMRDAMIPTPEESRNQVRRVTEDTNNIAQARSLTDTLQQATRTQAAQAQALGKTAGEAERLTTRAGLLNRATSDGIPLSEANRRRIDEVSDAIGRQTQAYADAALKRDILFQRDQLSRTPTEQLVAAQVRQVYGDNLSDPRARSAADELRFNASIRDTQMALSGLASMGNSLIDPLVDHTRSWSDAFLDLSKSISRAALQAALFGQGPFAAFMGTQGQGAGPGGLFSSLVGAIKGGGASAYGSADYFKAASAAAPGAYGPGFADGGYTGHGGRYEPAGVVHRGEYVFDAPTVSRVGVDALAGLHGHLKGYADGGYVGPASYPMPARSAPAPSGAAGPPNITFVTPPGTNLEADGPPQRRANGSYEQVLRTVESGLAGRARNGRGPFAGTAGGAWARSG